MTSYHKSSKKSKLSLRANLKPKHSYGFTIVELLIVIVVIGVLAAIATVAYNGISRSAQNASRIQELKAWEKLFSLYQAKNGAFPPMANGQYCLGSGFPIGAEGVARCRDYLSNGASGVLESENTTLMNELKTVGSLPSGDRTPFSDTIGPYVQYDNTRIVLISVFPFRSGWQCPDGLGSLWWTDGTNRVLCGRTLDK
jgi:prepilin-type N-terminal cleavage/methylation domain-containing protein